MPGIAAAIVRLIPGFPTPAHESDTQTSDDSGQESEESQGDNEESGSW